MSETRSGNADFSKFEKISISEMAEMISIYYDEIKAIAKNLEEEHFPLPPKDINSLHNSLLEYARIGTEFTEKFKNRAEKLEIPLLTHSENSDIDAC